MHERYILGEMGRLWRDDSKFALWLRVEIAVLETGSAPKNVVENFKRFAEIDIDAIKAIDGVIDHDMNAFLQQVSEGMRLSMQEAGIDEAEIEEILSWLHRGLTSYDIEDTTLAIRLKDSVDVILEKIGALKKALWSQALRYKYTPQIGRTHLQHAEPTTFGLNLLTWHRSILNHGEFLENNRRLWQVGKMSGAVGTFTNISPELEVRIGVKLKIHVAKASSQVVSREGLSYLMSALSNIASSLGKFARDIEHLSSTEVGEVFEVHGPKKQGSSAMPHKTLAEFANANKCERIYSLARLVRGLSHVAQENIDIRHQQDLTQSANERIILAGAMTIVDYTLDLFTQIMRDIRVDKERMLKNIWMTGGLVFSGNVAKALMAKGMPREEARELVIRLCQEASASKGRGRKFVRAVEHSREVLEWLTLKEIRECFSPDRHLRNIDGIYERFE